MNKILLPQIKVFKMSKNEHSEVIEKHVNGFVSHIYNTTGCIPMVTHADRTIVVHYNMRVEKISA